MSTRNYSRTGIDWGQHCDGVQRIAANNGASSRAGLCDRKIPGVSKFNSCAAKTGPGLRNAAGGGHAAALAEQISNYLRAVKENDPDAVIHIFATALNGLLFYLVQYHQAMAPYIVYDFYGSSPF